MVSTALLHKIELAHESLERVEHLIKTQNEHEERIKKLEDEIKALKMRAGKKSAFG